MSPTRPVPSTNKRALSWTSWRQPGPIFELFNFKVAAASAVFLLICVFVPGNAAETEQCEFEFELKSHSLKIVCTGGSPSNINIFAQTANVQADDVVSGSGSNERPGLFQQKYGDTTESSSQRVDSERKDPDGRNQVSEKPSVRKKFLKHSGKRKTKSEMFDNLKVSREKCEELVAIHSSDFSDVIMNATHRLKRTKHQLSSFVDSIQNMSASLKEGDANLRSDMEKLMHTSNSATELKKSIIATMRNQYSFMRYSLRIRNSELEKLVQSVSLLLDVTSEGLQGTLRAHTAVLAEVSRVNQTIRAVRRKLVREMERDTRHKRKDPIKPKDTCPKEISAVGVGMAREMDNMPAGAYLVESYSTNLFQPVWIMAGSGRNDRLKQYDAEEDVGYDLVARYFALPYFCVGTGHAIFRRHLYCHKWRGQSLVKYHLHRMDIVSEMELPGTGIDNFPYRSGFNSSVDLAVDELGLWVIFATHESGGKIIIAKVNHRSMEIERNWTTKFPKSHAGNAFMVCGALYVTDSHTNVPTHIRYVYDTKTATDRHLERGELPFPNSALLGNVEMALSPKIHQANLSMLSYDFKMSKILAWNDGRIEKFPIYFKVKETS